MTKLKKAQTYIQNNKDKVNPEYRLKYHVVPELGWMNDPNGFTYFNGEYHLFYQNYPYDSKWGPIHWGHVKSMDLIQWEYLPLALAPDMYYDVDGCFSGSAMEIDGKLYLMYTGHTVPDPDNPENIREVQNIAISEDGINFIKSKSNPVICTKDLPDIALPQDFRDPKVFKYNDNYFAVIASRNIDGSGQILLYKSKDMIHWDFINILAQSNNKLGKMWECPDFFRLDERDILILSSQYMDNDGDRFTNIFSCIYMIGNADIENGTFKLNYFDEIDSGFDFYAPQTLIDNKGRRIMIAWMQMWSRTMPTHDKNHHWAGAMILPRELRIINGKLYQKPIDEITKYRTNHINYKDIIVNDTVKLESIDGQFLELELEIDALKSNRFGLKVLKGEDEETVMYYDRLEGKFIFDRTKSGERIENTEGPKEEKQIRKVSINLIDNTIRLRIFIDRISVEVFVQDGEKVITSTVYPKSSSQSIEFFSDDNIVIKNIDKWDIEI